ncbi:hypothetical protein GCM10020000_07950 [Streptomyces olivoverticillatus]
MHEPGGAVVGERAVADEAAVAQDGEGVGDLVHLVDPVGDEDDGVAVVAQGVQDVEEPGAVRRGEAGGGLVQDDELGFGAQGAGDGHQGALGAREVGDGGVRVQVRGDDGQGLGALPPGPPPGHQPRAARVSGAQGDVLGDGHRSDQSQVLVDEGHGAGGGLGAERVPGDGHLALVRVVDAREHLDEGGLSGAVGAEQGQDAAVVDVEVDAVQRERAAELLAEAADADERPGATARERAELRSVAHRLLQD